MTMNTRIHIAKPVNPEALFLHVLAVLEADPSFVPAWLGADRHDVFAPKPGPLSLGKATYSHVRKGDTMYLHAGVPVVESESQYRTTLGQGLAAIWVVTYGSDGPLEWPPLEWRGEGDEPEEDYGNTVEPMPVHLVSANFDTAYGYQTPTGAHCGDLHAFLLREIALYLASVGCVEWVWHHEERGTWHGPLEIGLRGDVDLAARHFGRGGEHNAA